MDCAVFTSIGFGVADFVFVVFILLNIQQPVESLIGLIIGAAICFLVTLCVGIQACVMCCKTQRQATRRARIVPVQMSNIVTKDNIAVPVAASVAVPVAASVSDPIVCNNTRALDVLANGSFSTDSSPTRSPTTATPPVPLAATTATTAASPITRQSVR
ncbi:hypothetical protein OAM67_01875 [bacterium]|nr:hypothetical protein [bacterium]